MEKIYHLKEVRGPVKNIHVCEMLYLYIVLGHSKKKVIAMYEHLGVQRSYLARIISKKEGQDTSRRPVVRGHFNEFLKLIGFGGEIVKYDCPPKNRREHATRHDARIKHFKEEKGFGLINEEGVGHGR